MPIHSPLPKKINIALAAFGMSGKVFHMPFIQANEQLNLYGVWERRTKSIQDIFPTARSFDNFEALLADENIDFVVINTPNPTHFSLAKQALLANKNVIVEKSFTLTSAEADSLIAMAKAKNKILAVFQNRRWDSDFLTLKKVLDSNVLGEIVEVIFQWDRFKDELSPKKHKEEPQLGNGIIYDLGVHLLDQAVACFGMPNAIFATVASFRTDSKIDDYMDIILFYQNKNVKIRGNYLAATPLPCYIVFGKNGSFIKYRGDIQEATLQTDHIDVKHPGWGAEDSKTWGSLTLKKDGLKSQILASEKGNYGSFYENIVAVFQQKNALIIPPQFARDIIFLIEKIYESVDKQRIVQVK